MASRRLGEGEETNHHAGRPSCSFLRCHLTCRCSSDRYAGEKAVYSDLSSAPPPFSCINTRRFSHNCTISCIFQECHVCRTHGGGSTSFCAKNCSPFLKINPHGNVSRVAESPSGGEGEIPGDHDQRWEKDCAPTLQTDRLPTAR